MTPRARALVLAGLGLVSSGCINVQTLGTYRGVITPTAVMTDPEILKLAAISQSVAGPWLAVAGLVAAFLYGAHLTLGIQPKDDLLTLIGAIAISSALLAAGPRVPIWIFGAGDALAARYPALDPTKPWQEWAKQADVYVRVYEELKARITGHHGDRSDQRYVSAEGIYATFFAGPIGGGLFALALTASYVAGFILQLALSLAAGLELVLWPLVIPFLLIPQTRWLFFTSLRIMCTLALWGLCFRVIDAVVITIQQKIMPGLFLNQARTALAAGDSYDIAQVLVQGTAAMFLVHIVYFAAQAMAAVLAGKHLRSS